MPTAGGSADDDDDQVPILLDFFSSFLPILHVA
jgi:hypothetical protein